jgi:uncharacterized protein (DUF2236 family)
LNQFAGHLQETLFSVAQRVIGERIRDITGSHSNLEHFKYPKGDPGLLGPNSVAWKVHAHFVAMMVGGLSSLIVQSLNSRALSAVWDHSDFRNKLKERLGRTAYFVAATTYGGKSMATEAIRRVNAIHANIRGVDLDGKAYVANEPDLIRWVHLAEVSSFLNAYQHLSKSPLSQSECDQYIDEMTQVGLLLGAEKLPTTWQTTQEGLLSYKEYLRFDMRAREILEVVKNYPTDWQDKPFMHLVLNAAFDVMPQWVLNLIEKQPACALQVQSTRLALQLASEPIQWALDQQGVRSVAKARLI